MLPDHDTICRMPKWIRCAASGQQHDAIFGFFGCRLSIRIMNFFYRRQPQPWNPIGEFISKIRLRNTPVMDAIVTVIGFTLAFISTRFM